MSYDFHLLSAIFPLLDGEEFRALTEDIRENGLLDAITLHDGQILDGRNRYNACLAAGIEPRFTHYDGDDPLAFVVSTNVHRRHLTPSQRAALAVELLPQFEETAKRRQAHGMTAPGRSLSSTPNGHGEHTEDDEGGDEDETLGAIVPQALPSRNGHRARDDAAGAAGVSARHVQDAKAIATEDPALFAQVKAGKVTVPKAKAKIKERRRQAAARVETAAGAATVAHADALAWLASLARESADVLLTDPPYMTDVPDVAAFAAAWVPLALSRVKPSGRAYIFTGAYPPELAAYLEALGHRHGWTLDNVLVWTYRNTLGPSPKMGYKLNWQACFYLYGPDAPPLDCPSMVEQFTVQDIAAPDGRQGNRLHTWQKPDELAERLIRHSSRTGDLLIDPFAGTGTFLAAAARLGRVAMGSEIDAEMIAMCEGRGVARVEAPCAR